MGISDLDLPTGVVAHSMGDEQRQAEALADRVANALRSAVELDGIASLAVSGGRSPVPLVEEMPDQPARSRAAYPVFRQCLALGG